MKQVEDLIAQLQKEMSEPLHPDLIPYMETNKGNWAMLRHPLVYQVPFFSNGKANAYYKYKKEEVAQTLEKKNYKQFVWLHERPYRVEAFIKVADKLSDTDYWRLLSDVWIDTENQHAYLEQWKYLLDSDRSSKHYMMNEEEDQLLSSLPDKIIIYRGCQKGLNENGLSWTLDKSKAKFFANRFGGEGIILEKEISKSAVIAFLIGRGESEIIYKEEIA